jgi:hypothetical protein
MDFIKGTRVKHDLYGEGTITGVEASIIKINFKTRGELDLSRRTASDVLLILDDEDNVIEEKETYTVSEIEKAFIKVIEKYSDVQQTVPLGDKWVGGTMILKPGSDSLKPKEIPIDTFFHKIVMLRDRLRVLEQNINSNTKLTDEEKVGMQQYITRCYGSLTTFNVLFKEPEHQFTGAKGGKEE